MRKVIDGRLYDTDTAKQVGKYDYGYSGDFGCFDESLYRKKNGEFFLHGDGGPRSRYGARLSDNSWGWGEDIIPLNEDEAKDWVEAHCDADTYIKFFGPVEE